MKILSLALIATLLSGCVIDHRKSEPQSFTTHSRMASPASFTGTYENEAIDHSSRPQATLAEYEFGYWQPEIKQVDSVSIYIDADGNFTFLGMIGGKEKFRSTYIKIAATHLMVEKSGLMKVHFLPRQIAWLWAGSPRNQV
jgi:hypothetical protein